MSNFENAVIKLVQRRGWSNQERGDYLRPPPPTEENMITTNDNYQSVKRLVHQLAWRYWRRFSRRYQDLAEFQAEAALAYAKAARTYRPDRGAKLTTWVQIIAQRHLFLFSKKHKELTLEEFAKPIAQIEPEDIGDDAREAITIALDTPQGIGQKQSYVVSQLLQRGWSGERIQKTFEEVRLSL